MFEILTIKTKHVFGFLGGFGMWKQFETFSLRALAREECLRAAAEQPRNDWPVEAGVEALEKGVMFSGTGQPPQTNVFPQPPELLT